MREKFKKLIATLLALALIVSALSVNSYAAAAKDKVDNTLYIFSSRYDGIKTNSKGDWKDLTKMRLEVFCETYFYAEFTGAARIKATSSKKDLEVKVTYHNYDDQYSYDNATNTYKGHAEANISLYATKSGKYTVTVTADKVGGGSVSKKVTVLVTDQSGKFKTVKLGKQTIYSDTGKVKKGELTNKYSKALKTSAKSGKLKITPNTQYKITGIIVASVDAKGKVSLKKVKNGKKITLSKGYSSKWSDAFDGSSGKEARKYTYIFVSYKDTFTGDSCTYSITTKRGRKEIMEVYKNARTGDKSVSYTKGNSSATFALWNF